MSKADKALQERLRKDPLLQSEIARVIIYHTGQRGGIFRDIRDDIHWYMTAEEAPDGEIVKHCEALEAAGWIKEWGAPPAGKPRHPAPARMYDLLPKAIRAYKLIDIPERAPCDKDEWLQRREAASEWTGRLHLE